MNCGATVPMLVELIQDGDYKEFYCPSCDRRILRGGESEDGSLLNIPPYQEPHHFRHVTIPQDSASSFEFWWTDLLHVAVINGRVVEGDRQLLEFVEKIKEIHDDGN